MLFDIVAVRRYTSTLISVLLFASFASTALCQATAYGYSSSSKGHDYKKFTHNILGFSIDIPSTWTFGINGAPPAAVVIIYPEGLNTGIFSAEYEAIEIGTLPAQTARSLSEAYDNVLYGMKSSHPNMTMLQSPQYTTLNSHNGIQWTHQWPSKTGFSISEFITLIETQSGIRSLAVRTTQDISLKQSYYLSILNTFEPFQPKY